jgi:hypothetical protein
MKRFVLTGLLLALVSGCVSPPAHLSSFYEFRNQVEKSLSATCDCGPVYQDPISGWMFDIRPRQQPEFSIRVWKCKFLTQEEWNKSFHAIANQEREFFSAPHLTRDQVAREDAIARWNVPQGSYDSIGISVELQWPEMKPGEWEKQNQVNKDRDVCVHDIDEIMQFVKPYRWPEPPPDTEQF